MALVGTRKALGEVAVAKQVSHLHWVVQTRRVFALFLGFVLLLRAGRRCVRLTSPLHDPSRARLGSIVTAILALLPDDGLEHLSGAFGGLNIAAEQLT